MSEIVSKELLREVLDDDVLRIGSFNYPRLEIEVQRYSYKDWLAINIHELAHKCKEWALEKDCQLVSCIKKDRSMCDIYSNTFDCKFTHYADSEPEAIFKATQYILENKGEKN